MPKGVQYSTAEKKALAVQEIEEMVKGGLTVRAAVEQVAHRTGMGERTLFSCLAKTKGVAPDDREAALERKKAPPKKRAVYSPEALSRFIELCRSGDRITDCFRQLEIEANANGWSPIPTLRTLRRILDKQVSWAERYEARRAKKSNGGK